MFWPIALVKGTNSKVYSMSTYDSLSSLEEAKDVIKFWKAGNNLEIALAYITNENNIVYLENNVETSENKKGIVNVLAKDKDTNQIYSIHTNESSSSMEDAKELIDSLKNDVSDVLCAYITSDDQESVIYLENNVDAFGQVHYKKTEDSKKTM